MFRFSKDLGWLLFHFIAPSFVSVNSGVDSWEEMNRFELETLLEQLGNSSGNPGDSTGNVFILGDLETGPEITRANVEGQMPSVFQILQGYGKHYLVHSR